MNETYDGDVRSAGGVCINHFKFVHRLWQHHWDSIHRSLRALQRWFVSESVPVRRIVSGELTRSRTHSYGPPCSVCLYPPSQPLVHGRVVRHLLVGVVAGTGASVTSRPARPAPAPAAVLSGARWARPSVPLEEAELKQTGTLREIRVGVVVNHGTLPLR